MFVVVHLHGFVLTVLVSPCSGCEEDGVGRSLYPWASSSYCHDWNSYWSSVGNL